MSVGVQLLVGHLSLPHHYANSLYYHAHNLHARENDKEDNECPHAITELMLLNHAIISNFNRKLYSCRLVSPGGIESRGTENVSFAPLNSSS